MAYILSSSCGRSRAWLGLVGNEGGYRERGESVGFLQPF